MKNFYIAVQIKEDDKFYAYAIKVASYDNVLSKLEIPNIMTANICQSRKEAESWIKCWNDTWKADNRYMFDEVF